MSNDVKFSYQKVHELQPQLTKSLLSLEEEAGKSLNASLIHLIKLRVSQINGCGFCMHMHSNEARSKGEQQNRLDVLPAWREISGFSDAEKSALAWAERLTVLSETASIDELLIALSLHYSDQQIVDISTIVTSINSWNRIAIGFSMTPGGFD